MKYKVLVGINNDKTGSRYEIGEEFDNAIEKFDADVIIHWLARGVLKEIKADPKREVTLKGKRDK